MERVTTSASKSVPGASSAPPAKIVAPAKGKAAPAKKVVPTPTKNQTQTQTQSKTNVKSDSKTVARPPSAKPGSADKKPDTNEPPPKINQKYTRKSRPRVDKNFLTIHVNLYLGRVYSRLKEIDKAKSFYEKVIKKAPNVS